MRSDKPSAGRQPRVESACSRQQMFQVVTCLGHRYIRQVRSHRNEKIMRWQVRSPQAKRLPNQTPNSIACDSGLHRSFSDAYRQPRIPYYVSHPPYREPPPAPQLRSRAERFDRFVVAEPGDARQSAMTNHTARRARPFARRARSTALPPRVFSLARKPCVRWRRVLDG